MFIELFGSAGSKVSHEKGVLRLADEQDRYLAHQGTGNSLIESQGCKNHEADV